MSRINLDKTWPVPLRTLTRYCGYYTVNSPINNGYGCRNPRNEEHVPFQGVAPCYSWACPVAFTLSYDEPGDRLIMAQSNLNPDSLRGDEAWMIPKVGTKAAMQAKLDALRHGEYPDRSIILAPRIADDGDDGSPGVYRDADVETSSPSP